MRVPLSHIVFDAGTQIRAAIDESVVAQYAERLSEGDVFPVVVLFHDGNKYYMADGFHRGLANIRNAAIDIEADIRAGTKIDALWFALGANRTNGCRMTTADKQHAIELAISAWPEKSARTLAEQIGVNRRYFDEVKSQVGATTHLPDRVTGKDGKNYPASRPRQAPQQQQQSTVNEPEESPVRLGAASGCVDAPTTPGPERKIRAPSNGMMFARIAIMKLEEIRNDDSERREAFAHVREWLDARQTETAMHARLQPLRHAPEQSSAS